MADSIDPYRKPTLRLINREYPCHHGHFEVDDKRRTVTCGMCGALMDPFDVLVNIAYGELKLYQVDERNAKARLKNARAAVWLRWRSSLAAVEER